MAIDWGSWEDSGGNGMRVGIEVTVENVTHGETGCTFTVDYWTENRHSYSDGQTLNLGGTITGNIDYNNNAGSTAVLRATRTFTYDYKVNEYGSSPGKRTFSVNVSGAYNGVTPSVSVTKAIAIRPYAAPANVTAVNATWISDESIKVTWIGHPTTGEPYQTQQVQRVNWAFPGEWTVVSNLGSVARSFVSNVLANRSYTFRVRASNTAGDSGMPESNRIWTTPGAPTGIGRTEAGTTQTVTWVNTCAYADYETQVWHAADGVWDSSPIHTSPAGDTSWAHTGASGTVKHSYRVRAKTTVGPIRYSEYSGTSSESSGVTSPPGAPTGLDPNSDEVFDPASPIPMSWIYHTTDGSIQRQFQIRHRLVGAGSWTTMSVVTSPDSSFTLPGGTYANDDHVEWQVMTWGSGSTGSAFSSSATFLASPASVDLLPVYLNPVTGMLAAGAASGGGTPAALGLTYVQPSSSSTWTIIHSLTFQPNVAVVDSGGSEVIGDVHYVDAATITITFSAAFVGTAYLS